MLGRATETSSIDVDNKLQYLQDLLRDEAYLTPDMVVQAIHAVLRPLHAVLRNRRGILTALTALRGISYFFSS